MDNTALSLTPRSVILRRVWLRAVWYYTELDSAQYNTAQSQQLKFTADPKVTNNAQSFADNNFVFAGLSFSLKGMLNKNESIGVQYKPKPTFFIYFLKG